MFSCFAVLGWLVIYDSLYWGYIEGINEEVSSNLKFENELFVNETYSYHSSYNGRIKWDKVLVTSTPYESFNQEKSHLYSPLKMKKHLLFLELLREMIYAHFFLLLHTTIYLYLSWFFFILLNSKLKNKQENA